ncbi:MAG: helix-turn-helix transcriptional regulator [Micrococcales bacterium]|nr:helix-turn-helix transcriptional regulator [Micrococcales bacterium]
MGPVFGHGQLRLYLLALLEAGPRSGYDVIRALEDRFEGLYSPSAGTVYPRLAKLEEEGLIGRADEGRRSIYTLLEPGREELDRRRGELEELQESLDESAGQLADQMRERVRTGTQDVRARLEDAARRARERAERASGSAAGDPTQPSSAWQGSGPWVPPGFGSGLPFGQGGSAEWVKLARWLAENGAASAARPGGWGSRSEKQSPGASDPAAPTDRTTPTDPADPTDPVATAAPKDPPRAGERGAPAGGVWSAATDTIYDVPQPDGPGRAEVVRDPDADGASDPTPGSTGDGSQHRAHGGWEELFEGAIPDAEQMHEISEIIRTATAQIQDVLRRRPS